MDIDTDETFDDDIQLPIDSFIGDGKLDGELRTLHVKKYKLFIHTVVNKSTTAFSFECYFCFTEPTRVI